MVLRSSCEVSNVFFSDCNQIWSSSKDFHKNSSTSNFTEISSMGKVPIYEDWQRQKQADMTKLIGVVSDYANAPNNDRPAPKRFSNSSSDGMVATYFGSSEWAIHNYYAPPRSYNLCVGPCVLYTCIFQWLLLFCNPLIRGVKTIDLHVTLI